MLGFRVLVTKQTVGNPYMELSYRLSDSELPWVAICQDRFPTMSPTDDGFLPPMFGKTKEEALEAMELTIRERISALGMKGAYQFLSYEFTS